MTAKRANEMGYCRVMMYHRWCCVCGGGRREESGVRAHFHQRLVWKRDSSLLDTDERSIPAFLSQRVHEAEKQKLLSAVLSRGIFFMQVKHWIRFCLRWQYYSVGMKSLGGPPCFMTVVLFLGSQFTLRSQANLAKPPMARFKAPGNFWASIKKHVTRFRKIKKRT